MSSETGTGAELAELAELLAHCPPFDALSPADRAGERAIDEGKRSRRSAEQDRLGERAMHRREEARDLPREGSCAPELDPHPRDRRRHRPWRLPFRGVTQ